MSELVENEKCLVWAGGWVFHLLSCNKTKGVSELVHMLNATYIHKLPPRVSLFNGHGYLLVRTRPYFIVPTTKWSSIFAKESFFIVKLGWS